MVEVPQGIVCRFYSTPSGQGAEVSLEDGSFVGRAIVTQRVKLDVDRISTIARPEVVVANATVDPTETRADVYRSAIDFLFDLGLEPERWLS